MLYLVTLGRTPQFAEEVLSAHRDYLHELRAQGRLELAGPFTDRTGGAYVINVADLDTARSIAFTDPLHTSGSSTVTVQEWDAS